LNHQRNIAHIILEDGNGHGSLHGRLGSVIDRIGTCRDDIHRNCGGIALVVARLADRVGESLHAKKSVGRDVSHVIIGEGDGSDIVADWLCDGGDGRGVIVDVVADDID